MPLTRKRFLGLAGQGLLGAAAYARFGSLGRAEGAAVEAKSCPAGTKTSDERFIYRGSAVGVGGRITDPPLGDLPAQAATTLPPDGGHAHARVDGYSFHGIVYVNSAYSIVRGNPDLKECQPVFRTVATATVTGLDVDGVIRADSIVASLESQQPEKRMKAGEDDELDIVPVGYFANLRIRGVLIDPQPHDHWPTAGTKTKIDSYRDSLYDPDDAQGRRTPLDKSRPHYLCSIFDDRSIKAAVEKIPGATAYPGGRIHLKDLGDIYLGELFVAKESRRLTMLRVDMASPPTGRLVFAAVEGDGSRPR